MYLAAVLVAGLGLVPKIVSPTPAPATIVATDGIALTADVYRCALRTSPVILLFHQADSGRSEYATIGPRLVLAGYNAIAIDQRSGGALFDPPNATVAKLGRSAPYLDVLRDMDATLAFAKREFPESAVYAWGSSYSASLAFAFAGRHPQDVAAVLAFSPAEYFSDKRFVRKAARRVRVPVFVDSASDPREERAARDVGRAAASKIVVDFVPRSGTHGSSTLRDDTNAGGAAENWEAVTAFLDRVKLGR
ncbi:MAG: hypothetical protein NVSMB59_01250 [Vulcanimicrobiaceae bacterium]